jgi:hypothetical protein
MAFPPCHRFETCALKIFHRGAAIKKTGGNAAGSLPHQKAIDLIAYGLISFKLKPPAGWFQVRRRLTLSPTPSADPGKDKGVAAPAPDAKSP